MHDLPGRARDRLPPHTGLFLLQARAAAALAVTITTWRRANGSGKPAVSSAYSDAHPDSCDIAGPISPSASVAILRLCDGLAEYLVLGDPAAVLDMADGPSMTGEEVQRVTQHGVGLIVHNEV